MTTNVGSIFLCRRSDVDKTEVKQGDTLVIFGQSLPSVPVSIEVDSAQPVFVNATSATSGAYVYDLNTAELDMGDHTAKAEAVNGALISGYSIAKAFTVGSQDILAAPAAACPAKADGRRL